MLGQLFTDPTWLGIWVAILIALVPVAIRFWKTRRATRIKETISSFLQFLQQRRIWREGEEYVYIADPEEMRKSVRAIREKLTDVINSLRGDKYENLEWLTNIQDACLSLLDTLNQYPRLNREPTFRKSDFLKEAYPKLVEFQEVLIDRCRQLCEEQNLRGEHACQDIWRATRIKETISSFLQFLQQRRIWREGEEYVYIADPEEMRKSVRAIREKLTDVINSLRGDKYENLEWLTNIQDACLSLLDTMDREYQRYDEEPAFQASDFFNEVLLPLREFQEVLVDRCRQLCEEQNLCGEHACRDFDHNGPFYGILTFAECRSMSARLDQRWRRTNEP